MSRKSRYVEERVANDKKEWRAGVYLRLSREDEATKDRNSYSIETQKMIIKKYLLAHSDIKIVDYYIDDGFSGTNMNRPGYKRLKEDFESRKINCIIIKDLSRLARNNEEAGKLIFVVFPFYSIRFISVNDKVDSYLDPQSVNNISIQFKNLMNDEYCRDLSKKVKSARKIRQNRGEFIGSFAPYGYDKDPSDHHKLIVDPIAAEVVRRIFQDFLTGKNYSQIAKELSIQGIMTPGQYKKSRGANLHTPGKSNLCIWSASTVRSILTDEMYMGTLIQGRHKKISYKSNKQIAVDKEEWMRYENSHEPIIEKETFDKVQIMVVERRKTPHTTIKKNIYSGIIFCGECGHAMGLSAIRGNSTYSAFYCKYYKQGANFCTRKRIKVSIISDAIIVALNQYLKFYVNFKDIMKASKEGQTKSCPKSSKIELENQLNELKEEKKDLYFQYKNECLTDKEYSAQRQAVDSKIVETQKAIDEIVSKQQESLEISENGFVSLFRKYKKFTKINSEILASFVKRITVYSSRNIEIEWKFKDELIELVNLAMEKGIELFFNEQDSFEIPPKGSYRNVF